MTINLLQETLQVLKENNRSFDDIVWVGCEKFKITLDNFTRTADINYDNGFGGAEVANDLLIVGKDFWLERREYDGSEWWEFKRMPMEPTRIEAIDAITYGQSKSRLRYSLNLSSFNDLNVQEEI